MGIINRRGSDIAKTIVEIYATHITHFVEFTAALLIKLDDLHDSLGIALLFKPRDTRLLEQLLPLLWQASELSCGRVKADMSEMDGVKRLADFGFLRSLEEIYGRIIKINQPLVESRPLEDS